MSESTIIFCGLSKNSKSALKKNMEFLMNFKKVSGKFNVHLLIIDSDSNDGSKEYLESIEKENNFINVIHKDGMTNISSRIERIKICRNLCLDFIFKKFQNKSIIYIPCDFDFFLFSLTSNIQLQKLIDSTVSKGSGSAVFPASVPYYYDIFALRAEGWLNFNSQLIVSRLKKYLKIGSFIWNYFLIFRYQLTPERLSKKKYSLSSAFGGIGIYNITNMDINVVRYETNSKNIDWYSEHLFFNRHFKKLEIQNNWLIEAPFEHIEYKSYSVMNKFKYILKTFKYDLKRIFKRSKN